MLGETGLRQIMVFGKILPICCSAAQPVHDFRLIWPPEIHWQTAMVGHPDELRHRLLRIPAGRTCQPLGRAVLQCRRMQDDPGSDHLHRLHPPHNLLSRRQHHLATRAVLRDHHRGRRCGVPGLDEQVCRAQMMDAVEGDGEVGFPVAVGVHLDDGLVA